MERKVSTKARILDAALALFNERGSSNVTTNHVAEHLGMSPGNLYYHYRSKEDLIRALFERLDRTWDATYTVSPASPFTFSDVVRMLHDTFETMWTYRFFYRETLVLLHNDADLAARYRDVRARGLRDTEGLLHLLAQGGLLNAGVLREARELSALLRIVADNWLTFKALGGEPVDPADLHEGVDLLMTLLRPYFTPRGHEAERGFRFARHAHDLTADPRLHEPTFDTKGTDA